MRTWLVLMFAAIAACNPPDISTPRPWAAGMRPGLGGAGTVATSGTGGSVPPPIAGAGTAGIGGSAGMVVDGGGSGGAGGVAPIGGAGSAGGGSSTGAGTGGSAAPVFDPGTDPNRNAVVAGTICNRLAEIQCAGEAFCCANPGRDRAACQQEIRSSCDSDALVDDIAADPAAGFDAASASTVFTELERLASQCDPTIAAYGESFAGLRSMFRGTVGPDGDCRPANPLSMSMAAAALASCTNSQTHACMPSLSAWRCAPHSAAGGHCFSDFNCMPGLFCDNPDLSVSGADCGQRKAVGASCSLDNECQTLFCRGGSCVAVDVQVAYCPAP